MALASLKLAFDVVNQEIVAWRGSATRLEFGQTTYNVQIRLVQPKTDSIPGLLSYEPFDDTDYDGIRIGIWSDTTGTLNDSSEFVLALTIHTDLTKNEDDADDPFWEGEFNCYTQQMADFIGAEKFAAAYFAVNFVEGSTLSKIYDHRNGETNCIVNAATDDGSGNLPLDMNAEVPTMNLPIHVRHPASGELYALERTSAGVLEFVWVNAP